MVPFGIMRARASFYILLPVPPEEADETGRRMTSSTDRLGG
jgi:hypothetical protein